MVDTNIDVRSEQSPENENLSHARDFFRVRWQGKVVCSIQMGKRCPRGGQDCRTCAIAAGRGGRS